MKCAVVSRAAVGFVGQSSGGYLYGAYQVAQQIQEGVIVTVFNDLGERYFSTWLWD